MARFLTFGGKVVAEQTGVTGKVLVRFHGDPPQKYTPVSATEWNAKKRFEYFDGAVVDRQTAIRQYKAAQSRNRN